jgi:hypothetical protein
MDAIAATGATTGATTGAATVFLEDDAALFFCIQKR